MADSKLSELSEVTSLTTSAEFLVNQSGTSVKITNENFLKSFPVEPEVVEAPETLVLGTISLIPSVSLLNANSVFTLPAGTHGKSKYLVSLVSGASVEVTNGVGVTTITFSAIGSTAFLKNLNGSWYLFSTNNVVAS